MYLNSINKHAIEHDARHWALSFSFGRALQVLQISQEGGTHCQAYSCKADGDCERPHHDVSVCRAYLHEAMSTLRFALMCTCML